MHKAYQFIGIILIFIFLSSCSNQVTEDTAISNSDEGENLLDEELKDHVSFYIQSLQDKDYESAYQVLSEVYLNAGITLDDFVSDFQHSNVQLNDYEIGIVDIRNRHPVEISEASKNEPYYLVSLNLKSKGRTREEYTEFDGSDVTWFSDRMWFYKEDDEWKFFARGDQNGVTWQPDAYAAAVKLLQASKDFDQASVYSVFSNFYKQRGLTVEDVGGSL